FVAASHGARLTSTVGDRPSGCPADERSLCGQQPHGLQNHGKFDMSDHTRALSIHRLKRLESARRRYRPQSAARSRPKSAQPMVSPPERSEIEVAHEHIRACPWRVAWCVV